MPEDYGQDYGNGYSPPPQQPQSFQAPQPSTGGGQQPPYGYGGYSQDRAQPSADGHYGYPDQPPKKGLVIGAIVGIVIGVIAFLALAVFLFLRLSSDGGDSSDAQDTPAEVSGSVEDDSEDVTDGDTDTDEDETEKDVTDGSSESSGVSIDINSLSDDWTVGEVNLAGVGYRLFESNYADLVANGWVISEYSKGKIGNNGGTLMINAGEWTTFTFENPSYPDCDITVGLGNLGFSPLDYSQCVITYLDVRAPYADGKPAYDKTCEFVISKGVNLGMTENEVVAAFGMPDENGNVSEDASTGFKSMEYSVTDESYNHYYLAFTFKMSDDGQYRIDDLSIGL